jgi:DNA replication protein DnaC
MDKPNPLAEANEQLLERRRRMGLVRQTAGNLEPLANTLNPTSHSPCRPIVDSQSIAAIAAGDARRQEWEEAEALQRARKVEETRRKRLKQANLPERHANRELVPHPAWSDTLEKLARNSGRGFLAALLGIRGAGKTQLGVEAIRIVIGEGGTGRYVKVLDLTLRLREAFKKDGPGERQVLEEFLSPDILVVDGLEERTGSDFEDRMISHLIDKRYDACLDTILISNQTPEAFQKAVGSSVVSRMVETGTVFECTWPSFRQPAGLPAISKLNDKEAPHGR